MSGTGNRPRWGQVRASPSGCSLAVKKESNNTATGEGDRSAGESEAEEGAEAALRWHQWRKDHLPPLDFPLQGFDHVHGQSVIDEVDGTPLGSVYRKASSLVGAASGGCDDDDELTKVAASSFVVNSDEFGSTKSPDDAPVGSLKEKWRLLPYFLSLRSLLRQHIDSFDHFVESEMRQIVQSPSACEIRSDHDPKFYLRYEDVWIGDTPSVEEESFSLQKITPFQCRLRDCTYSAPIYVTVRYTRGRQIVVKRNVMIGRMPIMLRTKKCLLRDKTEDELADLRECPYDPGGYFIIKGVEKAILIQEQLSKNRVILEEDGKGITASITSSTHERKSKAYILIKNGRVYLKNNTLGDDIPIAIVLKAMGIESDLELVQLVVGGSNDDEEQQLVDALALSLEEPLKAGILTQLQALRFIGNKIRGRSTSSSSSSGPAQGGAANAGAGGAGGGTGGGANAPSSTTQSSSYHPRKPLAPEDEAREVLANVVLSHVPVKHFDFRAKAMYVGHIVRRVLLVHLGKMPLDDKDYYGNKRLELAGNLLSLLFEDLFKIFNKDLKRQADLVLSKPNRAQAFDVVKTIRPDT